MAGPMKEGERPAGRVPVAIMADDETSRATDKQATHKATSSEATTKAVAVKEATSEAAAIKKATTEATTVRRATTEDATTKEVTTKEITTKEATTKEATTKEATTKEATTKEVTTKEVTTKEAMTKEATTKEATTKEVTTKEVMTKEVTTVKHGTNVPVFCDITNGDAVSAINRATSISCKNMIRNVTCLAQEGKLYNMDIPNLCPLGTNPGVVVESLSFSKDNSKSVRILFLMSLHGRSARQVKRLFKAIYHSDHYYYIHVDSVSY